MPAATLAKQTDYSVEENCCFRHKAKVLGLRQKTESEPSSVVNLHLLDFRCIQLKSRSAQS